VLNIFEEVSFTTLNQLVGHLKRVHTWYDEQTGEGISYAIVVNLRNLEVLISSMVLQLINTIIS
jgi:hypothetical protein